MKNGMCRIMIATSALIAVLSLSRCDCIGSSNPDDVDAASDGGIDAAQADAGSVDGALVDSGPNVPDVVPRTPYTAAELQLIAQRPSDPGIELFVDDEGGLVGMVGRLAPNDLSADTPELAAQTFVADLGQRTLGWTQPAKDLALLQPYFAPVPVSRTTDHGQVNLYTVHFLQIHRGLPIEGREASVLIARHEGEDGLIPGSYSGNLLPERSGFADPAPTPAVAFEAAFTGIVDDASLTNFHLRGLTGGFAPRRGRLVWSEQGGMLKLTWRMLARGTGVLDRVSMLVDADTGALLSWYQYAPTAYEDSTTTASGQLATWMLPSPRTASFLQDDGRVMYALASHVAPGERGLNLVWDCWDQSVGGCTLIERSTPAFNDSTFNPVRYAGDGWLNAQHVLDYYRTTFGWVSWDGDAGWLKLFVNYRNSATGQTWNAYGGNGEITMPGGLRTGFDKPSGAALSVVAHEFMHSILDATVPFTYQDESGAINEAMADLSGQLVRRWSSDLMANECSPAGDVGIRNMLNPPQYGDPDRRSGYVTTASDNGGVHTNSGIVNKAWALMVHGSMGAPFNGYEVVPLAANVGQASDILGQLVFSALENKHFSSGSTLRGFGSSLWAWCKAQDALFASYGTSATASCGTVHDALAATGLLYYGSAAAPTNLAVEATAKYSEPWSDAHLGAIEIRVRNSGTARFVGRINFELTNEAGDLQLNAWNENFDLQPGSSSDAIEAGAWLTAIADEMPEPHVVVRLWPQTASLDTVASDNLAKVSFRTFAYPAGGDQPLVSADNAITVRLAQYGKWRIQNGEVRARLLYRSARGDNFIDVSGTVEHPEPDYAELPDFADGYLTHMVVRPAQTLVLPQHQLGGYAGRYAGTAFGRARFIEDGNGTFGVIDSAGNPVEGELLLLVLNADNGMKTEPGMPYVFCLNCSGVRGGDFAVLGFAQSVDLTGHFPDDVLPMLQWLVPQPPPPQIPMRYFEMNFFAWLQLGDPVGPIARHVQQLNAGP